MAKNELNYRNRIELLAPAGRMESLVAAVEAGCDAVYLGGKAFNMRMLKSSSNFSGRELAEARTYTAQRGVKMYVTVNNLYNDDAVSKLGDYLDDLERLGVDALIVQDPAVIKLHRDMKLQTPLHASVQMGVNNLETVRWLEELGFERVILSKNLSLAEIRHIYENSHIGIEYFVHGDLCVSHTGQCYLSSFVFGTSGNQGCCRKPCRWPFRLEVPGSPAPEVPEPLPPFEYHLAHNDLCLYGHLHELIAAGVSSFKIEGRMREADYVHFLVSAYRRGLNRLLMDQDPAGPSRQEDMQSLHEHRVRDFTAGSIYGSPAPDSIGRDGSREPRFFSKAAPAVVLRPEDYDEASIPDVVAADIALQVKVGGLTALEIALEAGARHLVIDWGTAFSGLEAWTEGQIRTAGDICRRQGAELILELPRLGHRFNFAVLEEMMVQSCPQGAARYIVHDAGMLHWISRRRQHKEVKLQGGYGLNLSNRAAADFWMDQGLDAFDLSLELKLPEMNFASGYESGLIVHGPLCGLITDIDLTAGLNGIQGRLANPASREELPVLALVDELDQKYPVFTDTLGRYYVGYTCDLCLFPWLPDLARRGLSYVRIAGDRYDNRTLEQIIGIYRGALEDLAVGSWEQQAAYERLLSLGSRPLSAAAFTRNADREEGY